MSGHSKWNNIKRKKEKADGAKAKIFTKIGRELAVAVKEGGSADPAANSRLRDAIAKAKAANVPNDNIDRIIKKAAGDGNNDNYENVTYEGYGPSGVAVIVEALTDNRNRTAADVRHAFDKFGGNLGTTGCVSFMFNKKGVIVIEKEGLDEDTVMSDALEAGASDFAADEDVFEITTEPDDFSGVREDLEKKGYEFVSASWRTTTTCRTCGTTGTPLKRKKRSNPQTKRSAGGLGFQRFFYFQQEFVGLHVQGLGNAKQGVQGRAAQPPLNLAVVGAVQPGQAAYHLLGFAFFLPQPADDAPNKDRVYHEYHLLHLW